LATGLDLPSGNYDLEHVNLTYVIPYFSSLIIQIVYCNRLLGKKYKTALIP